MPNQAITINSDTPLDDFDRHFRVLAGPGAGKTYWLVNHIKQVLRRSKHLHYASRIACISYTTVAAEHIKLKLEDSAERVDVSTIHSFLYRNLVRLFLHFVRGEEGEPLFDYSLIDGHDEHKPTQGTLVQWTKIQGTPGYVLTDVNLALRYLGQLTWRFDQNSDLRLAVRKHLGGFKSGKQAYPFPINKAESYKKMCWESGRLHHEDVLYFAYRILNEHPELRGFISKRFPYIFLDEFQDTNPIQTCIVRWLAEAGSVIGVIGDPAQSIYAFQDAQRADFESFNLPGQLNYKIDGNRRSTNQIVNLLNHVRAGDLTQHSLTGKDGARPYLLVGSAIDAVKQVREVALRRDESAEPDLAILTRKNEFAANLRSARQEFNTKAWEELEAADYKRRSFIHHVVLASQFAQQGSYERAMKELQRCFRTRDEILREPLKCDERLSSVEKRGLSVSILEFLVARHDELLETNLLTFYQELGILLDTKKPGLKLTAVKGGKFKTAAESISYRDLADGLKLNEEKRLVRTIHNAKGTEFDSVLLCLEKESDLKHLINPQIDDEECRIIYVALSRAKEFLYISVPTLSLENESALNNGLVNILLAGHVV
jgi:DNA helicase-2/ATP-dependent DNA helicase PcrA